MSKITISSIGSGYNRSKIKDAYAAHLLANSE